MLDWAAIAADLDADGCAVIGPAALARGMRGAGRELCATTRVPQPGRDGAPRLRARRVQVLRLSAARARRRRCARRSIHRSPASPTAGTRRWAWRRATRTSTRRSSSAAIAAGQTRADAAAPAVRRGRLQLPAPGSLRRARVPAAGRLSCSPSRASDFTGGEFVLTEQRPRMQSRAEVVPLRQGDGVVFPVHHRPVRGTRGVYRVNLRHGVSRVRSGPAPHARHHLPRRPVKARRPCGLRYFSAGRFSPPAGARWFVLAGPADQNQRKTFAPRCKSTVLITPGIQPGRASKIETSPTETAGCNLSA